MTESINYGKLMHRAMRGLIMEVLSGIAEKGELPGEHHFFVTFETSYDGVEIAEWLRQRYPGEMTIVIQHWFEDLDVSAEGFGVTLNFGDQPERLYIPYDAIATFVDPSVEFGLRFESQSSDDEDDDDEAEDEQVGAETPEETGDAEVVSLDSFRK
ncbi:MAG: ClpXP protease specificity-enhancing factor SspB [Pseudomonadota bacterium]